MKLETFFEKFDQFADAPDAVAKLRELVLQLAVQGKLVDQLPGEEPADKLLERIQKSKERLIKGRAIRRQETDSINCDSAPFTIPQSWVWTRLGEIGDWGSGSTPPRGNHDLYDGGISWLKSGELNDNLALAGSSETVTELALKTGSFRRNQQGDVLFAMYGATIGKVAILAEPAVTNQAVCGCTPFEGVLNRYLFNYLVSQRAAFHEASEGGAQPNLSKVKIVAFPFPLPPLPEQKRIVAKVDELMALCDRLEAQQQERETRYAALVRASLARFADAPTPANFQFLFHSSYTIAPADLRKSILTLAVQGKLVPQDPNDEPAVELLHRLVQFKIDNPLEGRSGRCKEAIVRNTEEDDDLPLNWTETMIGEVLYVIRGASPRPKGDPHYFSEMRTPYHWVKISDIRKHGQNGLLMDTDEFLTEAGMRKSVLLPKGTLVLTNSATIGVPIVLGIEGCCIHDGYLAFPNFPHALLSQKYVLYLFHNLKKHAEESARGLAQLNLNSDLVRSFPFGLPPLAEQHRIVAKVDQLMALVDELETQLAASHATAAKLLAALVAELTTQV